MATAVFMTNFLRCVGVVQVATALDYEATQSFDILVEVADQGTDPAAMSTTVLVTVVVTDVNEATPV